MSILKEYFGFNGADGGFGYQREADGFFSFGHIAFVTSLVLIMVALAVFFGRRNRNKPFSDKLHALMAAAILIDSFEIFKLIIVALRSDDPCGALLMDLPLFLCSIQLITIPLAAFSKGRVQEAALDFVCIFGMLGALLGTYGAAQIYGCYPVLSFDTMISGITHTISGFAALYIMVSGLCSMKKKNIGITFSILIFFCIAASVVNELIDYNYMFLRRGDGTPYDILYNLVGGHPVLYPIGVILLFVLYIVAFYGVFYLVQKRSKKQ